MVVVAPFGVLIDLGIGFEGLLLVPEMAADNRKRMEDYPQVGQSVTATVLWHNDQRKQFSLTQRLKDTAG